jgi:hypothetical protein
VADLVNTVIDIWVQYNAANSLTSSAIASISIRNLLGAITVNEAT